MRPYSINRTMWQEPFDVFCEEFRKKNSSYKKIITRPRKSLTRTVLGQGSVVTLILFSQFSPMTLWPCYSLYYIILYRV